VQALRWVVAAVLVALAFTALAARAALSRREPRAAGVGEDVGGDLPPTPLQRVAWWTLAAGIVFAAAVVGALATFGVRRFLEDAGVRLPVTGLMLATIASSLAPMILARRGVKSGALVDERDLEILGRAPRVQGGAVLVCQALWTAAFMEVFRTEGTVPMAFVVVACWSCFVVHALALPVGILLGYRRR
jgi:hypothetical protein